MQSREIAIARSLVLSYDMPECTDSKKKNKEKTLVHVSARRARCTQTGVKGRRVTSDRASEKERSSPWRRDEDGARRSNVPAMTPLRPRPEAAAAATPVSLIHGLRGNGGGPRHALASDRCCCCCCLMRSMLAAPKPVNVLHALSPYVHLRHWTPPRLDCQ